MKRISLFILVVIALAACNNEGEESNQKSSKENQENKEMLASAIKQPFENVAIPANKFKVDAVKGAKLKLDNGTTIVIPENAFVREDGTPITGEIDLEYKEFHSLSDILISGIPMKYDSAGAEFDFKSAGMFDIKGYENGDAIEVADDKSLEVLMASYEDTPCYNFYELDEQTGDWDYKTTKNGEENPEYRADLIPDEPKEVASDALVFDFEISSSTLPDLEIYEGLLWQYDGANSNELDQELIGSENWREITLEKTPSSYFSYNLVLKSVKNSVSVPVVPAFSGQNLEEAKAWFGTKMGELKQSEEMALLAQQGKMIRSISIEGFGTYNWDIVNKRENSRRLLADFNIKGKPVAKSFITVFLISPDEEVVVNYTHENWSKFSFDPGKRNKIIATLPGNEVAVFTHSQFKKHNVSDLADGSNYTFEMSLLSNKVETPLDLEKILSDI